MVRCEHCDERLPIPHRADARYCSTRCRVAAHRKKTEKSKVPLVMREADRWVRWKRVVRSGRTTKMPLQVKDSKQWKAASSTDNSTWSTYEAAQTSKVGCGLGFVLNGDGIVCIDLDHCVSDGVPNQEAKEFLARFPRTYCEISPSGDGLHIWGRGRVEAGRRFNLDGLSVEVYGTGRYMTVTEKAFISAPLADLSQGLVGLI